MNQEQENEQENEIQMYTDDGKLHVVIDVAQIAYMGVLALAWAIGHWLGKKE